jgi:phosphoglycerate dehydrogenase-like enzyme
VKTVVQHLGYEIDPEGEIDSALRSLGVEVRPYRADVPVAELVADATVTLNRDVPLTAATLAAAPELKLIQRVGVHLYGVDFDYCRDHGIYTAALPSWLIPGQSIAEHALYLMLVIAKKYGEAQRNLADRVVGQPMTIGLAGKTLGVLGVGRTATPLVEMARAIGMNVIGLKNEVYPGLAANMRLSWLGTPADLPEFLAQCDVLSLHVPLSDRTRGLIGAEQLAMLPQGAILVNTSRAPIVDYDALLESVLLGHLGGVGLDVWWTEPLDPADPLFLDPRVVVTPHQAGAVRGAHSGVAQYVADNVRRVIETEPPRFLVGIQ